MRIISFAVLRPTICLVALSRRARTKAFEGRMEMGRHGGMPREPGGVISQSCFSVGEGIETGDVLTTLDPRGADSAVMIAHATLARAAALRDDAQRKVDRLEEPLGRDRASDDTGKPVRTDLDATRADDQIAQVTPERVRLDLSRSHVRAPAGGFVDDARHLPGMKPTLPDDRAHPGTAKLCLAQTRILPRASAITIHAPVANHGIRLRPGVAVTARSEILQ